MVNMYMVSDRLIVDNYNFINFQKSINDNDICCEKNNLHVLH